MRPCDHLGVAKGWELSLLPVTKRTGEMRTAGAEGTAEFQSTRAGGRQALLNDSPDDVTYGANS